MVSSIQDLTQTKHTTSKEVKEKFCTIRRETFFCEKWPENNTVQKKKEKIIPKVEYYLGRCEGDVTKIRGKWLKRIHLNDRRFNEYYRYF